jgi:predicted metal-binding protein
MTEMPRPISKLTKKQIQKDLKKYKLLASELGASDAHIINVDNLLIQERIRCKCIIPKCAEYGTNLHCPPYSFTAKEMKEILKEYTYGLAVKIDIDPKYTAGVDIHRCFLRGELDELGHYRELGKQYKKMFFIVSEIESKAFYDGYYLATGFAAGSCKNVFCFKLDCQGLQPGKGCRNPLRARPSMEAVGFDVFGMACDLGWKMYPIGGKTEPFEVPSASLVGLILIT